VKQPPQFQMVTYVMHCDGYLKVGKTETVERRIRQVQVSNPHEVTLLSFIKGDCERRAHVMLAENGVRRVIGEWFEDTNQARDVLRAVGVLNEDAARDREGEW
jgi:hypothetical protein